MDFERITDPAQVHVGEQYLCLHGNGEWYECKPYRNWGDKGNQWFVADIGFEPDFEDMQEVYHLPRREKTPEVANCQHEGTVLHGSGFTRRRCNLWIEGEP